MRCTLAWVGIAAAFVLSGEEVDAKACTSTQLTQLTAVATTYSSSPDCAGSALDSSTNTVAVICAGACMKLVRQLQPDTPDCEYDGTNLGESLSELVAWCDAAAASSSGSMSTSGLGSAAGSASAGSNWSSVTPTDTVPTCTVADVSLISDLNSEATTSVDCLGSAGAAMSATTKEAFCTENACVAYLSDMETRLPNCTYSGYNIKQVIADTLALCNDSTLTWAPSTTPPTTITTAAPTVTTRTPTATSSASSQTTDTPAGTESTASALQPSKWITTIVCIIALVFGGL
ncbi:unnamed protein product [Phytophthora lilii]|uniref:Unnamed protein product n=1 Tax=Phytophthora lilii TaxID=2077276 RepID=A0A9W6TMP0_9STRA|nr:unnamed protein product [Phytophthora lilii]